MKKLIYFVVFLFVALSSQSQQAVDSLLNILNTQNLKPGEQQELYYKLYEIHVLFDLDKASEYAQKGLVIAEKENNKTMASKFNAAFGRIHNTSLNFDTALAYWEKALDYAVAAKDKEQEALIYTGIGVFYAHQSKNIPAVEYFTKALSIFESTGNKRRSMLLIINIASIHRAMDNYERAIDQLEKAKDIAEELDDAAGKSSVYYELGAAYFKVGMGNNEPEKADLALEYGLKAYEIFNKRNDLMFKSAVTQLLSAIYNEYKKDYDLAMKYANECLQISEEIGDPRSANGAWNTISNVYRAQNRHRESEAAALKAWEMDSTHLNIGINLIENIVIANIFLGNKSRANEFFHKYIDIVNQHVDQSNREALLNIEVKYETEKKEMQIAALEEERKLYAIIGIAGAVILILLAGLLLFLYRLNVQKSRMAEQQIKQFEQEKQLVATQALLAGETSERSRLARDLHDGLGGLLSVIKLNLKSIKNDAIPDTGQYDKALEIIDQSISELRRVAHHMMPESLIRYGLKTSLEDFCRVIPGTHFQYVGEDKRLDNRLEVIIYRCAYELINNVIKHAYATIINVQLIVDEGLISLSVSDNGRGFDTENIVAGLGLENIRTRISAYSGKLNIYSSPDSGTEVNIEIESKNPA